MRVIDLPDQESEFALFLGIGGFVHGLLEFFDGTIVVPVAQTFVSLTDHSGSGCGTTPTVIALIGLLQRHVLRTGFRTVSKSESRSDGLNHIAVVRVGFEFGVVLIDVVLAVVETTDRFEVFEAFGGIVLNDIPAVAVVLFGAVGHSFTQNVVDLRHRFAGLRVGDLPGVV